MVNEWVQAQQAQIEWAGHCTSKNMRKLSENSCVAYCVTMLVSQLLGMRILYHCAVQMARSFEVLEYQTRFVTNHQTCGISLA